MPGLLLCTTQQKKKKNTKSIGKRKANNATAARHLWVGRGIFLGVAACWWCNVFNYIPAAATQSIELKVRQAFQLLHQQQQQQKIKLVLTGFLHNRVAPVDWLISYKVYSQNRFTHTPEFVNCKLIIYGGILMHINMHSEWQKI